MHVITYVACSMTNADESLESAGNGLDPVSKSLDISQSSICLSRPSPHCQRLQAGFPVGRRRGEILS